MKRALFAVVFAVMAANAFATGIYTIGGFRFLVDTGAKTATLVPLADGNYKGDVVVPSEVALDGQTYPVIAFADKSFSGCDSLTSISIPASVTALGTSCFYGCKSLTSVIIPESVKSLGENCFSHCFNLTTVTIPNSITVLSSNCFDSCSSLDSVRIPSSVTSLGSRCFQHCRSLTSITIPSSVSYIGGACFSSCYNLASVNIPSSVTELGIACFQNCSCLTDITIPSSVVSLGESCFLYCSSLASITIPSSVTSIGHACFSNCLSLKSIDIPTSVTSLDTYCFRYCKSLGSIRIPSSVEKLGDGCFYGCDSLKSVVIPSSVTYIGGDCFTECNSLSEMYCFASNPPVTPFVIYNHSNAILCVPAASVDKYKSNPDWNGFMLILPVSDAEADTSVVAQCAAPTITYANKQLKFESSTAGAEYHYTLTTDDSKNNAYSGDGSVALAAAYNITAYATADGYRQSDNVTATLYWVDGSLEPTNINAAKTRGVLASSKDGVVTLSGLNDGERVAFYTLDGQLVGQSVAVDGTASYAVGKADVVIAKIGQASIKIAVK